MDKTQMYLPTYKRSKYGKLPLIVNEETPCIYLLVDPIDHMDFKNHIIRYPINEK